VTTPLEPLDAPVALISEVVFPTQLNHHGTYFGGAALSLMARAALVAATRVARADVVMAAVERVDFAEPIGLGELVEAFASVERIGRRSMTVAVELYAERIKTGERRRAIWGSFQMVTLAESVLGEDAEAPATEPGAALP
jgi:acyl-CoA hydrolase